MRQHYFLTILKKKIAALKGGFFHALKTFGEKNSAFKSLRRFILQRKFLPAKQKSCVSETKRRFYFHRQ